LELDPRTLAALTPTNQGDLRQDLITTSELRASAHHKSTKMSRNRTPVKMASSLAGGCQTKTDLVQ